MEHQFEKLDNFRDLGGIVTVDGRKVASRRLLRSAELTNLTDGDIRLLSDEYHVANVVDLRTERKERHHRTA